MGKRFIEQFMWGFQDTFRISLNMEFERAFEHIGFAAEARCLLVGFKAAGDHPFDICVEQGEKLYTPEDFSDVQRTAIKKYNKNPESSFIISDPRGHRLHQESLMDGMRAEALGDRLASLEEQKAWTFFVSKSVRVGDYEVHIIAGIPRDRLGEVPRISTTSRDRMAIVPSLAHAVIWDILGRARRTLYLPDAGSDLRILSASTDEIVRSATEHMLRTIIYCAGYWFASDFHLLMNQLSSLPYEGREGAGRLVLARADNPAIEVNLKLAEPVKNRNTPAVRKLLEGSGPTADVLSNGEFVYGLGTVRPDYDPASDSVFVVTFLRRGYWELSHAGTALLAARDGIISLPKHVLDESYFRDLSDRLFSEPDDDALTQAAQAIGKHRHGAMLVISADAKGEARRLSPQSWAVEPTLLSDNFLTQLTDMDGAVLLDPQGRCHAIGVILDGSARGEGDPARGSRFNNAVRYLGSEHPPAIVVVYSADGGIDILPELHPRVLQSEVNEAVTAYLALSAQRPPDLERVNRLWKSVDAVSFYLSAEQCEALNQAREEIEDWRMENMNMRLQDPPLRPDSRMDSTYWRPESD
ncbi:diadenylate cyclase [Streptomyces sp. NBC_01216]|uniref:diadenylate cyclase n=1 Tax=Streptomyces sp. NBC_01216 TaxID=2903778 RepID=UPI002E0D7AB2|nr:diadenylate cyclase [Streptomyces sp. NBC_01216]